MIAPLKGLDIAPPQAYPYARRGFCGLLVPYGNYAMEYEARAFLPEGFVPLTARLSEDGEDLEARLANYFDFHKLAAALTSYGSTPLLAAGVACSSTSYIIGIERELEVFHRLNELWNGRIAWTTEAVDLAFAELGTRRFTLVSPYPAGITAACIGYWERRGYSIEHVEQIEPGTGFHPIYTIPEPLTDQAVARAVARSRSAVFITGTGLATLAALGQNRDAGVPVLSANLALCWRLATLAGLPGSSLTDWLSQSAAWRRHLP